MSKQVLPAAVGVLLIIGTGILNGMLVDRWGGQGRVEAAAARLDAIPKSFGDWTSVELETSERQLQMAEAASYISRQYVHSQTGESVTVLILCGPQGPLAVHPPTVCFQGAGWALPAAPETVSIQRDSQEPAARFQVADFVKNDQGAPLIMKTFWGWSDGSTWDAPENPRWEYAGHPFLYKMYVSTSASSNQEDDANTISDTFIGPFLAVVHEALQTGGN